MLHTCIVSQHMLWYNNGGCSPEQRANAVFWFRYYIDGCSPGQIQCSDFCRMNCTPASEYPCHQFFYTFFPSSTSIFNSSCIRILWGEYHLVDITIVEPSLHCNDSATRGTFSTRTWLCSTGLKTKVSKMSIYICWLRFHSMTTKFPTPWMLRHCQTITAHCVWMIHALSNLSLTFFMSIITVWNELTLVMEHQKGLYILTICWWQQFYVSYNAL